MARAIRYGYAAGEEPAGYASGGCALDTSFDVASFYPRWQWQPTPVTGWAYQSSWWYHGEDDPIRWVVDVDGDGYPDLLRRTTTVASADFYQGYVSFTRLLSPYSAGFPDLSHFRFDSAPIGITPSSETRTGPTGSLHPLIAYADINGDGYNDLAYSFPTDNSGIPRIRPGDGRGYFGCNANLNTCAAQTGPVDPTPGNDVVVSGADKPWSSANGQSPTNLANYTQSEFYFHDVTGDGLADIIVYDHTKSSPSDTLTKIKVWVNIDGVQFECVGPVTGDPCTVGVISDSYHNTIPFGRVSFADMNADGVDDVVVTTAVGIFSLSPFAAPSSSNPNRALRPGLLTRIDNGRGAVTDVTYTSLQQLDMSASPAWTNHVPLVEQVVTAITTRDTKAATTGVALAAPYSIQRTVDYRYREPAYDRWSRRFLGFRKVASRVGAESAITETTFWFGPCETSAIPVQDAGGPVPTSYCEFGSDDELPGRPIWKAMVGKPVRVDRYIPGTAGRTADNYLWSREYSYQAPAIAFTTDRSVTVAYPTGIDERFYDTGQPVSVGTSVATIDGGDPIEHQPEQAVAKTHHTTFGVDTNGTLVQKADWSDAGDIGRTIALSDDGSSVSVTCNTNWVCVPQYVNILADGYLVRQTHLIYDTGTADITESFAMLDVDHSVARYHAGGLDFSSNAPGQAVAGWKLQGSVLREPDTGAVTLARGPGSTTSSPAACTEFVLDVYRQYPKRAVSHLGTTGDPCSGAVLETDSTFDTATGQVATSTAPDGGLSAVEFDPFGRPKTIYAPNAENGFMEQVTTIAYGDAAPLGYRDVRTWTGPDSNVRRVTLLNGLLEPVLTMSQGEDTHLIFSGWTERNSSGQTLKSVRSWRETGASNPITIATSATALTPASNTGTFTSLPDSFGRPVDTLENSQVVQHVTYFPLAVETRDAEQVAGGSHTTSFSRVESTARGIPTVSVFTGDGGTITTTTEVDVFGNPLRVSRSDGAGTYTRQQFYDSLGRMLGNLEPNTSVGGALGWHYAWDDANRLVGTSDARGCGANFFYDGLGRKIGEDYSPCLNEMEALCHLALRSAQHL